jgi:glucosamine--fructose-6-phosphate aminotransferase (isomerizing)
MASQLLTEIDEQPAALARVLRDRRDEVRAAAACIRAFDPEWVHIAARGTSDNAARYAQYVLGSHNRLGVGLAVPSLFTLYGTPPKLGRALTIAISQSGQAPDVLAVLEEAKRQGGVTLAVTNDPASPLALAADVSLTLSSGSEQSIAATKTYTNQLLLLAMLSAELEGDDARADELAAVPDAVAAALAGCSGIGELASGFGKASRFVVLGRGFNYCTAFEIALKMKETSYVLAEPYSIADLLHGPVAMIEYGFPVVLIAPSGQAMDDIGQLLAMLKWKRARTLAISDRADILAQVSAGIAMPAGVPEWLSPIVAVVPGQIFAHALARTKGLDPDAPRGLSKVTKTL